MATPTAVFVQGQELSRGDLDIFLLDTNNQRVNAAEIYFAIFDVTTGTEILVGSPTREPANPETGEYYAPIRFPDTAPVGLYRIRWFFRETVTGPQNIVVQDVELKPKGSTTVATSQYSTNVADLIRKLRILLRDNNPDRNYHFRPPVGEGAINSQTRVFGYIWEDYELYEYLDLSVYQINLTPPLKSFTLERFDKNYTTVILLAAMIHAIRALTINWVEEEFSYSIGGISLDIEKSSKYQGLMSDLTNDLQQKLEMANQTVKYTAGLKQSRYGIGIRSAFGPHTGGAVLTPSKFMRF